MLPDASDSLKKGPKQNPSGGSMNNHQYRSSHQENGSQRRPVESPRRLLYVTVSHRKGRGTGNVLIKYF